MTGSGRDSNGRWSRWMAAHNSVHFLRAIACAAAVLLAAASAHAITPDNPRAAAIQFTLNSGEEVKSSAPYIYGMNFFNGSSLTNPVTLDRLGGNRWSAYNWETNDSNAGKDYKYQNDNFLTSSSVPGAAVRPSLQAS